MNILNESNICVTTTAMPRPELLEQTYRSFQDKIKWLDFKKMTLFLNIDLFPSNEGLDKKEELLEIGRRYFGSVITNKIREPASFPLAVRWLFSNVDKEFVLNIEDDWELLSDIPEEIGAYFANPEIMQVGLRAWRLSDPRFVLSPSFLRGSFCKLVAKQMTGNKNPEFQIRGLNPYRTEKAFIYWPFDENKIVLKDLGRGWIKTTKFVRGGDDFTRWHVVRDPTMRKLSQEIRDQNLEIK